MRKLDEQAALEGDFVRKWLILVERGPRLMKHRRRYPKQLSEAHLEHRQGIHSYTRSIQTCYLRLHIQPPRSRRCPQSERKIEGTRLRRQAVVQTRFLHKKRNLPSNRTCPSQHILRMMFGPLVQDLLGTVLGRKVGLLARASTVWHTVIKTWSFLPSHRVQWFVSAHQVR